MALNFSFPSIEEQSKMPRLLKKSKTAKNSRLKLEPKPPDPQKKLQFIERYLLHGDMGFVDAGLTLKSLAMDGESPTNEHFPSFDDRARASTRLLSRAGCISPAHSAHGSLLRASLVRITTDKRAKKVRFYRNGDRFFKGLAYAVSPERFRTFESLMSELTASPFCDRTILPKGVRHLFTIDGSRKVTDLSELEEGESYVCASTQVFHKIDYPKSANPNWNHNNAKSRENREACSSPIRYDEEDREYIKPRLITVVGSGTKPRKAVRILLNKKTAHSFDQVLNDITDAIKLDTGAVKRIFTVSGKPVTTLRDFFQDDSTYIAYGNERLHASDDFEMENNEVRFVNAYRSVRQKERITLRSPKPPRRLHPLPANSRSSSKQTNGDGRRSGTSSPHSPASPRLPRRAHTPTNNRPGTGSSRAKSPAPKKPLRLTNGHMTNGMNGTNGHTSPEPPPPINRLPAKLNHKYSIGKVIGEGNFATVKECCDREKKTTFALKIISKVKCRGKEKMIENEVSILRNIKHANIIQLLEDYETDDTIYLVMELVTGGDLFNAIGTATNYTEKDASGMLYNLGCAIKYLHSHHIVHRDIKPENLLVCEYSDGSKALKLGDFGLATIVTEPLYTVCGTPTYVAPEVLAETGYGLPVDIWSAGVLAYILLCGYPPFASENNNQDELFDKIMGAELVFMSPFWDSISTSAKDLISMMLQADAEDRLTADEVLNHPWVSDDEAKDEDIHNAVCSTLEKNFVKKTTSEVKQTGVTMLASTALDHGSRYFQGRKPGLGLNSHREEDEVF